MPNSVDTDKPAALAQIELEFGSVGFVEGGKPENPEKNPRSKTLGARQEPTTNSTHVRRRVRESNSGHRGGRKKGRRALIHCATRAPLTTHKLTRSQCEHQQPETPGFNSCSQVAIRKLTEKGFSDA